MSSNPAGFFIQNFTFPIWKQIFWSNIVKFKISKTYFYSHQYLQVSYTTLSVYFCFYLYLFPLTKRQKFGTYMYVKVKSCQYSQRHRLITFLLSDPATGPKWRLQWSDHLSMVVGYACMRFSTLDKACPELLSS